MADPMRIRAVSKDGLVNVKVLMSHEMDTGQRKDSSGKLVPAHFIQNVVAKVGDRTLLTALWSGGVSKNPYLSFKFTGAAKGEKLEISWTDNKGATESETAEIE